MFELLVVVIFCWLFVKVLKLAFSVTWGLAKIAATILCVLACPLLIMCLLFASGLVLIIPVLIVLGVYSMLKAFAA